MFPIEWIFMILSGILGVFYLRKIIMTAIELFIPETPEYQRFQQSIRQRILISRKNTILKQAELKLLKDSAGKCGVCGEILSGTVRECAYCKSSLHEECWKYNNSRCTTYACKCS